ncbi:MAG: cytochrome C biogenesis protein [Stappia sp.]|uniref:cytochrome c biogenesis CcdA family protein n=1 Tax=Stappia sp. TaxID=1870903 RepID=UPI000C621E34|nr:cytochrome c biogenesis protein CcdA [Stappia sp.]MAA96687.1 cytochrome C biogenesis protein [Stappia sp.]MBM21805.1 cytochrome C biogenesis protein [Stappia sp.]|tara:strand:+ start:343 stop:1080 length:738 start_codon:yes stop_codon:yes gene_type:complete
MLGDVTVAGAFLAGLLSFVSPCVLPLVPPYLGFLAGVSLDELTGEGEKKADPRRIFFASLAFVLGFSTVFVALGASASFIGQFVTRHLDILGYVAGVAIILMGLHFLGVFRISLFYREARVHVERKPAGLVGAYVIGLAFAFGWTPCVGPILASILFVAGSEETVLGGAVLLAAYALGIGIPFLAASLFAGPFMRFMIRFRRHMGLVEKAMGVLMILTGIAFMTGQMARLSFWLLETFPVLSTIG